jgi:uncharacterized alkaline shock family protein YloU
MTVTVVGDDGSVTITDAVLHQIVAQAVDSVGGARLRKRHTEIAIETTGAHVQLELAVRFGRVLPDVARAVQEQVASALGTMCGVTVTSVDVTVEELD